MSNSYEHSTMTSPRTQRRSPIPLKINTAFAPSSPAPSMQPQAMSASVISTRQQAPQFMPQEQVTGIFSQDGQETFTPTLLPRIEGGFFLHDGVWTCYRRNFIRVVASFELRSSLDPTVSLSGETGVPPLFVLLNQQARQVHKFVMNITGTGRGGVTKKVELVTHLSKRDNMTNVLPSPRAVCPGGNAHEKTSGSSTPLTPHPVSSEDGSPLMRMAPSIVTFDRLQFRTATANNGKRKAIQQYFGIGIELIACLDDGSSIVISRAESDDIVVRGRSPGHYADIDRAAKESAARSRRPSMPGQLRPWASLSGTSTPLSLDNFPMSAISGPPSAMLPMEFNGMSLGEFSFPVSPMTAYPHRMLLPNISAPSLLPAVPQNTPVSPMPPVDFLKSREEEEEDLMSALLCDTPMMDSLAPPTTATSTFTASPMQSSSLESAHSAFLSPSVMEDAVFKAFQMDATNADRMMHTNITGLRDETIGDGNGIGLAMDDVMPMDQLFSDSFVAIQW